MNDEIAEHLHELIRDNWGMSMREIERNTGLPRRLLQKTLGAMVSKSIVCHREGRYVTC